MNRNRELDQAVAPFIDGLLVNGARHVTVGFSLLSGLFDKYVVDGLVNFSGTATEKIAVSVKKLQSGKVQQYTILYLAGVILISLVFIYFFNRN